MVLLLLAGTYLVVQEGQDESSPATIGGPAEEPNQRGTKGHVRPPPNDLQGNMSTQPSASPSPEENAESRFARSVREAENLQSRAFSDLGGFVENARKGEAGVASAAFTAVANRASGLKTVPGYAPERWTELRVESFQWLEKASERGDLYAMWLYGGQAEMLFAQHVNLSDSQHEAIGARARVYLFSLVSNGILEAFPRTAAYYIDGTLGKKDLVMAALVLQRYQELGGKPENISSVQHQIQELATRTDFAEASRLLNIMRANSTASEIGRRI